MIRSQSQMRPDTYHRLRVGINLTLRTDIAQDLDYMILNIEREGATWPPITLINIYNQKNPHPNTNSIHEWTADHLHNHIPHHSIPTIIARDWNMRDPSWDNSVNTPNAHTRETLEWLRGLSFKLTNKPNVPTREDNSRHTSTIDLVFTNNTTLNSNIISNTLIDTEISSLSNHHALTFTIGPPQEEIQDTLDKGLNWKHADEEKFCKALRDIVEHNQETHSRMVRDLLNQNRRTASESELDEAVEMIQNYLEQATANAVPTRHVVSVTNCT